jgi:uncharacterized membrane protein YhiD involved in acid resistance
MTNTQLYLAIGIPVVMNALMFTILMLHMNSRFDSVSQRFDSVNQRVDDMKEMWRAELRRVEEVIDARLKHLEER